MITHWIQVGKDSVAVDSNNGVCGVLKWLDDEILTSGNKVSQIGSQEAITACSTMTHIETAAKAVKV